MLRFGRDRGGGFVGFPKESNLHPKIRNLLQMWLVLSGMAR